MDLGSLKVEITKDPTYKMYMYMYLITLHNVDLTHLTDWSNQILDRTRCDLDEMSYLSMIFFMQSGKVHFGYIYGVGLLGCSSLYAVLNLMSVGGVSIGCVMSVLGYCLLPMTLLSAISVVVSLKWVDVHVQVA